MTVSASIVTNNENIGEYGNADDNDPLKPTKTTTSMSTTTGKKSLSGSGALISTTITPLKSNSSDKKGNGASKSNKNKARNRSKSTGNEKEVKQANARSKSVVVDKGDDDARQAATPVAGVGGILSNTASSNSTNTTLTTNSTTTTQTTPPQLRQRKSGDGSKQQPIRSLNGSLPPYLDRQHRRNTALNPNNNNINGTSTFFVEGQSSGARSVSMIDHINSPPSMNIPPPPPPQPMPDINEHQHLSAPGITTNPSSVELQEGTPGFMALQANSSIKITKFDKVLRKLQIQAMKRMIKKGASFCTPNSIKRDKHPCTPNLNLLTGTGAGACLVARAPDVLASYNDGDAVWLLSAHYGGGSERNI